ncbi:MAG TPA: response regulator transcription factor [Bacillota bacterium]|jgi:DNA-binding response OmpR family regulator|nr:response regulator transcription factor [Bacillota bacterium]HOL09664.1 response regulator transcription factor [Bacillota bacterium]HPO97516.1 response regulator transcription factor [Bacillota bacterium]
MKVLLVEDEIKLANALAQILKRHGYQVDVAYDGNRGLEMAESGLYDLIVLDRMLPGKDGVSIIKELRRQGMHRPVLFLTAKDAPADRVEGLDAGADDYLIKPFSTEELLARLRALSRRKDKEFVDKTLSAAGLTLDPLKGEVSNGTEVIQLTVKEAMLLELLMRHRGQVVTKELIFERVWGYDSDSELGNIDLYIHYLRKKLKVPCIKTVRGIGYYLQEDADVS